MTTLSLQDASAQNKPHTEPGLTGPSKCHECRSPVTNDEFKTWRWVPNTMTPSLTLCCRQCARSYILREFRLDIDKELSILPLWPDEPQDPDRAVAGETPRYIQSTGQKWNSDDSSTFNGPLAEPQKSPSPFVRKPKVAGTPLLDMINRKLLRWRLLRETPLLPQRVGFVPEEHVAGERCLCDGRLPHSARNDIVTHQHGQCMMHTECPRKGNLRRPAVQNTRLACASEGLPTCHALSEMD